MTGELEPRLHDLQVRRPMAGSSFSSSISSILPSAIHVYADNHPSVPSVRRI